MEYLARFTAPGATFLLTLAFGFWLSSAGRPYNGLQFNVHKLLALGAVVLSAVQISRTLPAADPAGGVIVLLAAAGACAAALFATGALMSMGKLSYGLQRAVHRTAVLILVILTAGAVFTKGIF